MTTEHPSAPRLFDQDASEVLLAEAEAAQVEATGAEAEPAASVEAVAVEECHACRGGRCGECTAVECRCPHPFAAGGRAIVELSRASQALGQLVRHS